MTVISKQLVCQKYIYKIHSSRLRKERWKLSLPIEEARRNDEVISLADSQVLRWIDELNGITDADEQARKIKQEIRRVRKEPNSIQNKRIIKQLYTNLDKLQYKPDYMCLIIDKQICPNNFLDKYHSTNLIYFTLLLPKKQTNSVYLVLFYLLYLSKTKKENLN